MPPFPAPLDAATLAGALAAAVNASWPLLRSRERVLALQVLASLLFGLHYLHLLLGATTAAAMAAAVWRGRDVRPGARAGMPATRAAGVAP